MLQKNFVCAAFNCSGVLSRKDQTGKFFQEFCEQGHYGGHTKPTNTRQGLYVVTPSGKFLSSQNTNNANQVRGVLNTGLRRWSALKGNEPATLEQKSVVKGRELQLPEDGIVLREVMRDLPRPVADRNAWRYNLDHLWLTQSDCLALLPEELTKGAKRELTGNFKRRLLLYHCVDQVRGESNPWVAKNIEIGTLVTTIKKINDQKIGLSLNGKARMVQKPSGERNPFTGTRVSKERGVDLKIAGVLIFDRESQTFERFNVVAVGERWGTDVYSFRHKDPGPHPIGFAFELLSEDAKVRPEPAYARWNEYF